MTERDFWIIIGRVQNTQGYKGEEFAAVVSKMTNLLDAGDYEDIFGTEGWRGHFGWNE